MSDISDWSTTPANNNSTPPDGFPEGMAPSAVNDSMREIMAAVRRWYEDAAWIDFGYTYTRISSGSFSIVGDYTSSHHVGRRVKMSGSATAYGTIGASTYSAPNTTIELLESTVPATLDSVALSIITNTNSPMPYGADDYARLSASNAFTGTTNSISSTTLTLTCSGTFTLAGLPVVSATIPRFRLYDTNAGSNAKYTEFNGNSGFTINLLNDDASAGETPFSITRSGSGATAIALAVTGSIGLTTGSGISSTMGATGSWALSNGTVTAGLGYSATPTFQIGTTSSHNVDLYAGGTTRVTVRSDGAVTSQAFTVATLPSAITTGRAFVTDATATTFASIVAGGGSNRVPVYSDGTNWRIG